MMAPALPEDIMYLICEELALQEQFDTLFSCALTSRAFAMAALTHLYRSQHLAPVRGGGDEETVLVAAKKRIVKKWAVLWSSIVASSLDGGATLFPYCRYIKTLDLRDLRYLFEDNHFKGKIAKDFFSGPLARFDGEKRLPKHLGRLDVKEIIDAIGDVVTTHTPMLECISGELLPHALVRWAPRLPRLQTLELYDGSALLNDLVHDSIFEHCPLFNSLSIYNWGATNSTERDHKLAKFLATLRPQSLKMIETIRNIGAAAETFLALKTHSNTLKDLRLCVSNESLSHLSLLRECTNLESLRIEDADSSTLIDPTQNDLFAKTIDWLTQCTNLRSLSLINLQMASALVTPLLREHNIRLRKLEIDPYVPQNQMFHRALTEQRSSLQVLSLTGETEGMFRDDVVVLVDSIKQLTELTTLKLILVQEIFHDEQLIDILDNLKQLEDLYITGMEMKDGLLECMGSLKVLRSVTFSGISKFTTDGLLEFVSRLGPGNQGIRVMVDMADADTLLSDEEVALIREALTEKVGGTIEYTPIRDPNVSDFEGDSD